MSCLGEPFRSQKPKCLGTSPRLGGDICSISTPMPLSAVKAQAMRLTCSRFHTRCAPWYPMISPKLQHTTKDRSLWIPSRTEQNFTRPISSSNISSRGYSLAFFGQYIVSFIFIGDGPERLCLWVEFLDLGDFYVI